MHSYDIFCITVSLISGVQLSKTRNFDYLLDGGFGFHTQFVPIPRIRKETIEKPIVCGSKTYFFGFDPEKLIKISETAKRDLEDEIRSENARLNTMARKLAADFREITKAAVQEMQAVKANGGPPPIGAVASTQSAPDTPPVFTRADPPLEESLVPTGQAKTPELQPSSVPATPPNKSVKTTLAFSLHLAGARGTNDNRVEASGYCSAVKDMQSEKVREIFGAGDCSTVVRAELAALSAAFEQYPFPPSSETQECIITIFTPTEYLANMFNRGLLKRYSANGWKKKDGNQPQNLDLLKKIWEKAKLFTVKSVIVYAEEAGHVHCMKRARDEGAKYHQAAYGLISPNGK